MKNILFILSLLLLMISTEEVFAGKLYGIVRHSNGNTARNIEILVYRGQDYLSSIRTDGLGNYSIYLSPGNYTLIFQRSTVIDIYVSSDDFRRDIYLN